MKVIEHTHTTQIDTEKAISAPKAAPSSKEKNWMHNYSKQKSTKTVSATDLISLSALIAYVATDSGETEFGVERRLSDRFHIPNVSCLPADQYDNAIRYLVDGV